MAESPFPSPFSIGKCVLLSLDSLKTHGYSVPPKAVTLSWGTLYDIILNVPVLRDFFFQQKHNRDDSLWDKA